MSANVLKDINIHDETPIIVGRNGLHVDEEESVIHSISNNLSIPIFFGNGDDTQDSNSTNIKKTSRES